MAAIAITMAVIVMIVVSVGVGVGDGVNEAAIWWLLWMSGNSYVAMAPFDSPSTTTSRIWYPAFGVIVKLWDSPGVVNMSPLGEIVPPGPADALTM